MPPRKPSGGKCGASSNPTGGFRFTWRPAITTSGPRHRSGCSASTRSGAPHYSFDSGGAHFTVLDNSRSDAWPAGELAWLEADLREHAAAPVKFVVSHRPSWLLDAALGNTNGPLHVIAKRYGVCCVVAGHVHQLIHADLDGVTYLSLPSAGGHLRLSGKYEDGWFFGWTGVEVRGREVMFQVHALDRRDDAAERLGQGGATGQMTTLE